MKISILGLTLLAVACFSGESHAKLTLPKPGPQLQEKDMLKRFTRTETYINMEPEL